MPYRNQRKRLKSAASVIEIGELTAEGRLTKSGQEFAAMAHGRESV